MTPGSAVRHVSEARHVVVYSEPANYKIAPLAAKCAMCTFHTFEKNTLIDYQPLEKSGLQYKFLVLILKIVYECIFSNETSLKQFSLEIKSYFPLLAMTLFTVWQILNSLG